MSSQACTFEEKSSTFQQHNAVIFGVSDGGVASKEKFIQDNKLSTIQLLIDENNYLRKLWHVPNNFAIIPGRVTYVINTEGRVTNIFNHLFQAEEHPNEALKALLGIN